VMMTSPMSNTLTVMRRPRRGWVLTLVVRPAFRPGGWAAGTGLAT